MMSFLFRYCRNPGDLQPARPGGERVGGELAAGDDARAVAFFDRGALPELAFASTRHAVSLL